MYRGRYQSTVEVYLNGKYQFTFYSYEDPEVLRRHFPRCFGYALDWR